MELQESVSQTKTALSSYLSQLNDSKYDQMTMEEERYHCENAIRNDGNNDDFIVVYEKNLKLSCIIALQYKNRGLRLEELISLANQGLEVAIKRYDITKGTKFSTYASKWIHQSLRRGIAEQGLIRIPQSSQQKRHKIQKFATMHPSMSNKQIGRELGFSEKQVRALRYINTSCTSLDSPITDDSDTNLTDFVSDENSNQERQELLDDVMLFVQTKLDDRERDIIYRRNGLNGYERQILEDVSLFHGCTKERVRQIEIGVYMKLKEHLSKRNSQGLLKK